ncbi:MAG TPA: helix-hairpin-helix domain-containing protein [Gemmataceae bacterium]|jgi:competence protein ComEA
MDSPAPSPPATTSRAAQFALAVGLALLLGLLLYRGYGNSLGMRPTDAVSVVAGFDVNSAERSDFEQIPGVGPKLAQAIVDRRGEKGRFQSLEQLRDVKGIGPATFDKVRPYLRVEPLPESRDPLDADPPILERKKAPPVTAPRSGKLQPGDPPIDINAAPIDDVMRLPGVGRVTAQAIVAGRPYRSLSDLDKVKGIGPKTLEKLRPFVKWD